MNPPSVPRESRALKRRQRDQRLRRVVRQILEIAPYLDDAKFAPLIRSYGLITLKVLDASEALREGSILNADGELRSSLTTLNQMLSTQLKIATALGLTPTSVKLIGKDKTIDLAAAFAEDAVTSK